MGGSRRARSWAIGPSLMRLKRMNLDGAVEDWFVVVVVVVVFLRRGITTDPC